MDIAIVCYHEVPHPSLTLLDDCRNEQEPCSPTVNQTHSEHFPRCGAFITWKDSRESTQDCVPHSSCPYPTRCCTFRRTMNWCGDCASRHRILLRAGFPLYREEGLVFLHPLSQ